RLFWQGLGRLRQVLTARLAGKRLPRKIMRHWQIMLHKMRWSVVRLMCSRISCRLHNSRARSALHWRQMA
ncbi:hypothetical protein BGZ81_002842, partial [Podila clonocystis]